MFTTRFGARALLQEARAAARFSAPMVGTRIFAFGQSMVVVAILGRHSLVDMAGMSLAAAVGQVLIMLGFGGLIGTQTEIARRYGAKDHSGVLTVLASSYVFALMFGIALGCGGFLVFKGVAALPWASVGGYRETVAIALPAMKVLAIGMPAYCIYLASSYYLEATRQPKYDTLLSVGGLVVAAITASVLIPDSLGLGLRPGLGAAWTLTTLRILQAVAAVCIVIAKTSGSLLEGFARLKQAFWPHTRALLRIGIPFALADCLTTAAVSSMTFLVGALGVSALNVYQMSTHFLALLMLAGTGVTTAITVRVTNAIGAGDIEDEERAASGGLLLLIILDSLVLLLFLGFPGGWSLIYSADPLVAGYVTSNQAWALLVFMLECPLVLMIGIGRAKGLTVRLPTIKAICFAVIALPVTYALLTLLKEPRPFLLLGLVPTVFVALAVISAQFMRSTRSSGVTALV